MKVFAFLFALVALPPIAFADTVLLEFTADWCAPCRSMEPVVAGLEREGYHVQRINIDRDRAKAQQFGVQSVPTFVVLKDGRETSRLVGSVSADSLRRLFGPPGAAPAQGAMAFQGRRTSAPPSPASTQASKPQPAATAPQADAPAATAKTAAGASDRELIARSVRLVLDDSRSRSFATGTVIRSVPDDTLILTCSHLFEGAARDAKPTVEFFGSTERLRLPGELLVRDREADVALVRVRMKQVVPAAPVATRRFIPTPGVPVTSVGCDNGLAPSVRQMKISAVNKFLGAATIECTGQPVQGRSGGGLFNQSGEVIGVCSAAEPRERRGIYAGPGAVQTMLDRQGLASLYNRPASDKPQLASAGLADKLPSLPLAVPPPEKLGLNVGTNFTLPDDAVAAEAICVVRQSSDPKVPAKVIVLDRISPELLAQLEREQAAQGSRSTTSMRRPNPPEWRPVMKQPATEKPAAAAQAGRPPTP